MGRRTMSSGARRIRTMSITLALVAAVGIGACGDDADIGDTERTRQETEGSSSGDQSRTGNEGTISADPTEEPSTVDVRLKEYEIAMPTVLRPGSHLFRVTNDGAEEHGLTVSGNGMDLSLPTNAKPGETQTLPIDLAPGSYRVFCPVDGHVDRGMALDITVSE